TAEGLARVERAEVALHRILGQGRLRVRDHFPVARIEIPEQSIEAAVRAPLRQEIVTAVTKAGYRYVAIDLMGYRMGSMNDRVTAR
ncbi:MAG: TIGR00268 family protein, partial [Chloroflexi bacterium]|nr:TIGR00268 family protein [Chloroflexota bacterium]